MHFIIHFCLGFLSGVGSAEILAFHMFLFVSLRDKDWRLQLFYPHLTAFDEKTVLVNEKGVI